MYSIDNSFFLFVRSCQKKGPVTKRSDTFWQKWWHIMTLIESDIKSHPSWRKLRKLEWHMLPIDFGLVVDFNTVYNCSDGRYSKSFMQNFNPNLLYLHVFTSSQQVGTADPGYTCCWDGSMQKPYWLELRYTSSLGATWQYIRNCKLSPIYIIHPSWRQHFTMSRFCRHVWTM